MAAPVRILAIDGGGIRGLIPAAVLAELERCAGRPVAQLFDFVAGTSTGGLLALGLTAAAEDDPGRPAYSAAELVELYAAEGPAIFSRSVYDRIRSAEGLLDEKYPNDALRDVLERYLGERRLSQTLVEVFVTAYETRLRRPFFFRSTRAREDPAYDYPIRDVAYATAAAPTYFEAARVVNDSSGEAWSLIDGGVFANNPALCALVDVLRAHGRDRDVLVVSLGTGEQTRPLPHERIRDWGLLEWGRPILDVIFDGTSDAIDFHTAALTEPDSYWRLQTRLDRASDDLDDAGEDNIAALRGEAAELIDDERAAIAALCEALAD